MQRNAHRMTRGQWISGGLVVLITMFCGILSGRWAEQAFSRPAPAVNAGTAGETHTRTCITLGGKRFEWNFPNPPFGTLSCSD